MIKLKPLILLKYGIKIDLAVCIKEQRLQVVLFELH